MRPRENIVGQRFGKLVVLERWIEQRRSFVRCLCDCGETITRPLSYLTTGDTRSCGCYRKEVATQAQLDMAGKHGEAVHSGRTPEYKVWGAMNNRCTNPRNGAWDNYGGRGITVCAEWRNDYPAFLAHVGRRPSPDHSIDRIDNDGNYEPGNVRWATLEEQNGNRRPLPERKHDANGRYTANC